MGSNYFGTDYKNEIVSNWHRYTKTPSDTETVYIPGEVSQTVADDFG